MMMLRGKTDPKTGKHTFVQACAVERHMDISQEPFCTEICRKNAGRKSLGHRVVRACAVETHMDISQKPLSVTVRTPSVWPHCLGKNVKKDVLPRSQSLFRRGLQSTAPATKNEPEAHDQLFSYPHCGIPAANKHLLRQPQNHLWHATDHIQLLAAPPLPHIK